MLKRKVHYFPCTIIKFFLIFIQIPLPPIKITGIWFDLIWLPNGQGLVYFANEKIVFCALWQDILNRFLIDLINWPVKILVEDTSAHWNKIFISSSKYSRILEIHKISACVLSMVKFHRNHLFTVFIVIYHSDCELSLL